MIKVEEGPVEMRAAGRILSQRASSIPRDLIEPRRGDSASAELGRALLALAHEQIRHQVDTLRALTEAVEDDATGKAVDWDRVLQRQERILHGRQERMMQLHRRYLELSRVVGMTVASQRRPEQVI